MAHEGSYMGEYLGDIINRFDYSYWW